MGSSIPQLLTLAAELFDWSYISVMRNGKQANERCVVDTERRVLISSHPSGIDAADRTGKVL